MWVRLGVSRTIYVNVDSPNLGFPYFNLLGEAQCKKHPVFGNKTVPKCANNDVSSKIWNSFPKNHLSRAVSLLFDVDINVSMFPAVFSCHLLFQMLSAVSGSGILRCFCFKLFLIPLLCRPIVSEPHSLQCIDYCAEGKKW